MTQKRKTHAEEFKARVAVEAIKGVRTLSELSAAHGVHPTVIAQWKRQLVDGASEVFRRGAGSGVRSEETVTAPLYQEIGKKKRGQATFLATFSDVRDVAAWIPGPTWSRSPLASPPFRRVAADLRRCAGR